MSIKHLLPTEKQFTALKEKAIRQVMSEYGFSQIAELLGMDEHISSQKPTSGGSVFYTIPKDVGYGPLGMLKFYKNLGVGNHFDDTFKCSIVISRAGYRFSSVTSHYEFDVNLKESNVKLLDEIKLYPEDSITITTDNTGITVSMLVKKYIKL